MRITFKEIGSRIGRGALRGAKLTGQSIYFAGRGVFKAVPLFAWLPFVAAVAWAAAPALASIAGLDRLPDPTSIIGKSSGRAIDNNPTGSIPSSSGPASTGPASAGPQASAPIGAPLDLMGGGGAFRASSPKAPTTPKSARGSEGGEAARADPGVRARDADAYRAEWRAETRPGPEGGVRPAPAPYAPPPQHPAMNPVTALAAGVGGLIGGLLGVHAMHPGAPGARYAGRRPVYHATAAYRR